MSFYSAIRFLILLLLSGLLAYIGDVLGYRLGKKRISLFSLRPRTTAQVIAIFTGVVIMFLTIGFASLISKDVRIALFNIDRLIAQQNELALNNNRLKLEKNDLEKKKDELLLRNSELSEQKKELREEKTALEKKKDELQARNENLKAHNLSLQEDINEKIKRIQELEQELTKKKEGELAFAAGELIGYRVLNPGLNDEELIGEFRKLIKQIIPMSKAKGALPRDFDVIWKESSSQRDQLITFCKKFSQVDTSELIVMVICQQNVFKGDKLGIISFRVEKNRIVQPGGYHFAVENLIFDGSKPREEIALSLGYMVTHLKEFLKEKGMIETELINEIDFYDTVNYLKSLGEKVKVYFYFKDDLYLYTTELPSRYRIIIERTEIETDKTIDFEPDVESEKQELYTKDVQVDESPESAATSSVIISFTSEVEDDI